MGYLSDTAVFNHLLDSTFLAAFFEKGLRANNTTVNAAMECGCAVITNLDEHSPAGLVAHDRTCSTSTGAIGCRRRGERSGSAGRRARSRTGQYGWDRLVAQLRAVEPVAARGRARR